MGILFGIVAIITAVALAVRKGNGMPLPSSLPDTVKGVILSKNPSRDDLGRAAMSAEEAGYPTLAQALQERAKVAPQVVPSPWNDILSSAWSRYCVAMINGRKPGECDPRGFYGMFRMSVRRLCDLDIMKNPVTKQAVVKDPTTGIGKTVRVCQGEWITPRAEFLSSPSKQYAAFSQSSQLHRMVMSEKYKRVIGLPIEGQKATLSGLLAACHMAGAEGLHKWLINREYRSKFKHVTDAYNRANGIF